jgi:hypothetical protein
MERFYNEDSDDKEPFFEPDGDDEGDMADMLEGEAIAFMDNQNIIDVMHMDIAQTELNQQLLAKAMEFAKQNWLWCFKSNETKMKEIEVIYKRMLKMTETEEGEK